MKTCPYCGKRFNWLQRAVGEDKQHARHCRRPEKENDELTLASTCRGCPAGCFEKTYDTEDRK